MQACPPWKNKEPRAKNRKPVNSPKNIKKEQYCVVYIIVYASLFCNVNLKKIHKKIKFGDLARNIQKMNSDFLPFLIDFLLTYAKVSGYNTLHKVVRDYS